MRQSRRFALACAVVCALAAHAAGAQDVGPEAEHQRGMALRSEGRHEEARQVFQRIWERTREPRALARMALAEGALGLWVDAEAHLAEALAAESDPWIRENRVTLQANLESQREHVGAVDVQSPTPGARVSVRGAPEIPLPLSRAIRVPTGQVVIEVTAPSHRPLRRVVNTRPLAAGTTVETFALERLPPGEQMGPAAPSNALRYVGYTLLGVGAVLAGLSIWQYTVAADISSSASSAGFNSNEPYRSWFFYANQTNGDRTLTSAQLCDQAQTDAVNPFAAETRSLCSRMGTANALAVGLLVPALVSIASGAVMVAVAPRAQPHARVALSPYTGPTGTGLTLSGRF